ncbi:peptide-methionine (S)-S-oxide reductase MsrA [Rheinheimera sp. WS51]|uniref:peptide-methionine (S)-S-oxide reductase MsrA n=1 Tax=Rheinheimera sp. WS51 TaxID=3425886 RepID=UPI003D8AB091
MKRLFVLVTILIAALFIVFNSNSPRANTALVLTDNNIAGNVQLDSIVLGAGCFWGVEKRFAAIDGVIDAVAGYADGRGVKPNYRAITSDKNRHNPDNFAEVVQVTFDPARVTLNRLLQYYYEQHDPTQLNRQGNDIGSQYRSTILTSNQQQLATAQDITAKYQQRLMAAGYGDITTVIKPLTHFYPAEDYHQDYLAKNPNGYCPDHATGVRFAAHSVKTVNVDNTVLQQGKQILVIDSESYCPYCEKFKAEVASTYSGDIPLQFRYASQLSGLTLKTATWATPTIILLEDGEEVFGRQGYLSPDEFYLLLGKFKLGNSEAFNVAFDEGTDGRFCQQYEIFKNTPDGIFVDKLSGAPLFDTRDRFDSGTGWLSFTKPVAGAVIEKPDNRYGMRRIEIRAKVSGIHLGHVFNDGPNGKPRYCINATVLDFVPRG